MSIPKIIHYCWFGGKEKPQKIQKCIASWHKYCPDYQIVEWNDKNFDFGYLQYSRQAYEAGKFAFVSDVARVKALYEQGGIYLDTDVEVFRPFDPILSKKCVLGFEAGNYIATSFMACEKGCPILGEFYSLYKDLSFLREDGSIITGTNVNKLTRMLVERGLKKNNQFQTISNEIEIYPQEYFSPYDYINCISNRTEKSFCEHKFYVSWMPGSVRIKKMLKKMLVRMIGVNHLNQLRNRWNHED